MLYIITPCSRPENLELILPSIPKECHWIISHDDKTQPQPFPNTTFINCKDTGKVGTKARNFVLDNFEFNDDDFIQFHDDDNIIHPKWFPTIQQYLNYEFSIISWGQLNKDGTIRLQPSPKISTGAIDTASYTVSWKYNKNVRHRTDVYEHDGIYAEECAKNGRVLTIYDYLCYYNYLRT